MRRVNSGKTVYHPNRLARQQAATERRELSQSQTPQQRLLVLDDRLGVGVGAVKERLRLHAKIAQLDAQVMANLETEKKKQEKKGKRQEENAST